MICAICLCIRWQVADNRIPPLAVKNARISIIHISNHSLQKLYPTGRRRVFGENSEALPLFQATFSHSTADGNPDDDKRNTIASCYDNGTTESSTVVFSSFTQGDFLAIIVSDRPRPKRWHRIQHVFKGRKMAIKGRKMASSYKRTDMSGPFLSYWYAKW